MTGGAVEPRTGHGGPSLELHPRADRIQIAMFGGVFAMFAALLAAGALGFTTLSGQLLDMQKQVGDLRTEMQQEIGGLRAEMHREFGEMRKEISDLTDRMTRVETLIETHLVPAADASGPAASP